MRGIVLERAWRQSAWRVTIAATAALAALGPVRLDAQTAATLPQGQPITVIASNGVRTLVDALVPDYERTSGRRLRITYGTSSGLMKSIESGEPFDVVVAAADGVDRLFAMGSMMPGTRTSIGRSQVGVGVKAGAPRPDVRAAASLKQALLEARAVTFAADGASRPHIEAMFARLGIADAMKPKTLLERGSAGSLARVVAGDATFVITLVSEILPAPGVDLVGALPQEFRSEVAFAAGVSARPADAAAARALVAYLAGPAAAATLASKGLER